MTIQSRIKADEWLAWSRCIYDWPRAILYQGNDTDIVNSRRFLAERPEQIICLNGEFYSRNEDGIWKLISADQLEAELLETDKLGILNTRKIRAMIDAIRMRCRTEARPFTWIDSPASAPPAESTVLFRNGVLDVQSGRLYPLDGSFFATATPDFDHDSAAKCPTWLRCLDQWLDVDYHRTVQEFFGYALTPDNTLGRFLVLIGASRGGKSTMANVLVDLVGTHHHSTLTMNHLGSDFGLQSALDKRLVVIPDASDELRDRSVALTRLKAISGNDAISINRKHLKMMDMKLATRFVLVANKHPKFLDDSGALARRELVIQFRRSIPETERDPDLPEKLRVELPGVANWSLEGLRRLRRQGHFTVGEKGKAAARVIAEAQAPTLRFANERLEITGDHKDFVPLAELYGQFTQWMDEEALRGGERRNRSDFATDFEAGFLDKGVMRGGRRIHDGRSKAGKGKSVHGFRGLKIREEWVGVTEFAADDTR